MSSNSQARSNTLVDMIDYFLTTEDECLVAIELLKTHLPPYCGGLDKRRVEEFAEKHGYDFDPKFSEGNIIFKKKEHKHS